MIKILCIVVNNPTFIYLQYNLLKKFFKGEFEFIIFNDAKDFPDHTNFGNVLLRKNITNMCKKLGLKCINLQNNHHKKQGKCSLRHCDSLRFLLNYMKKDKTEYLILDSDMFLVNDFDINEYRKYWCSLVLQNRKNIKYMWPNFFYINMEKIENIDLIKFDNGEFEGVWCDTGGASYKWLKLLNTKNPEKIYYIQHLVSCRWDEKNFPNNINNNILNFVKKDPRNINNTFYCEIYDKKFLHLRAGSNWDKRGIHVNQFLTNELFKSIYVLNNNKYQFRL